MPVIDGVWAGKFSIGPVDSSREGWVWMGTGTPYMVWSSARVYTNVPAGPHTFSVQCWANLNNVVLPGPSSTSIASLLVFEVQ
jgi:hypothetical protein